MERQSKLPPAVGAGTILIVDDDDSLRRVIEFNLKKSGYRTMAVPSGEKALKALRTNSFDLVISDMKMPGMDGIQLLEKTRELQPEMPVIFITAFGTIEKAVEAIKLGAYDYVTKPFDAGDFLHKVNRAMDHLRLKSENIKLRAELEKEKAFSNIIGSSQAMQRVFATVEKVAATDATVLITGESGTGKELIAKSIHHKSDRSENRLITVNCAAIPKELLESELFGHVAGAFTGAIKDKTGKFVAADGGTIFLDEIGDMPLELQAKLLRVLEDKIIEPVGSEKSIAADIRVLAATNTDLRKKVRDGSFREDLFYRLNVVPINIPPLRERPEDIPLLVEHFLSRFRGKREIAFDDEAMKKVFSYGWPGNVRELENLIRRLVILVKSEMIRVADLPGEMLSGESEDKAGSSGRGVAVSLIESEKRLIIEALERCGWNQSRAARMLKIPRHVLIYRMKKHSLKKEQF